jgi:hypothetical protein
MARSHLRLVTPTTKKRTVRPKRPPNADLRTREYLTEAEVERLLEATRRQPPRPPGRYILVAYRHTDRPTLGSGGIQNGHPARSQDQIGHA